MTVGTFLGIRNGRSLVIGALCDISLDTGSGGQAGMQTTGRVDLLGEVLGDESGTEYFQRGVMNYPKIGSAILPVDHHALRIIFDISGRADQLAFEFGLWSDGALPLLIVCEEAHNYANADRTSASAPRARRCRASRRRAANTACSSAS